MGDSLVRLSAPSQQVYALPRTIPRAQHRERRMRDARRGDQPVRGNLAQQAPDLSGLVSGLVVEKSAAARSAFERHFQERDGRSPVRPLDLLISRMLQNLSRMVLRRVRK